VALQQGRDRSLARPRRRGISEPWAAPQKQVMDLRLFLLADYAFEPLLPDGFD
jgi:hypothetical protein